MLTVAPSERRLGRNAEMSQMTYRDINRGTDSEKRIIGSAQL